MAQAVCDRGNNLHNCSKGHSYDNVLYEAELILRRAPWKTRQAVELATLDWASWFNNYRLMAPLGDVAPVAFEANDDHSRNLEQRAMPA
jgi:putative transposase